MNLPLTTEAQLALIVRPTLLLRLEGAALLAAAVYCYAIYSGNWLLFILLLFAPDLSAIGYLVNSRLGSTTYNIGHTLVLPALLIATGLWGGSILMVGCALIWFAHIGMDRMVGYGFKLPAAAGEVRPGRS